MFIIDAIVTGVTTAALTVSGAACDAGTFIADTTVNAAGVVCEFTTDTVDNVGTWIGEVTNGLFGTEEEVNTEEETGFKPIQVEEIEVEEIQMETILYEDVTTTWPD